MIILQPEVYTVKDVAVALRVSPDAIRKSIKRTGAVRGVHIDRRSGVILFSRTQYERIVRL